MTSFHEKHSEVIEGCLSSFDRVVFKGHLKQLCFGEGVEKLLSRKGMLIKDFGKLAESLSKEVCSAAEAMAEGRPYKYLASYRKRKEQLATEIAERDGITEGLVAVFGVVEGAQSFRVASGKGHPRIANAARKCKCLYFYYLDAEFGMMHVRLQSWLPFPVQVCLNGNEWLRRQLDRARFNLPWQGETANERSRSELEFLCTEFGLTVASDSDELPPYGKPWEDVLTLERDDIRIEVGYYGGRDRYFEVKYNQHAITGTGKGWRDPDDIRNSIVKNLRKCLTKRFG